MSRTNQEWVEHLSGSGPTQGAAITDLRGVLVRRLGPILRDKGRIDNAFIEDTVQDTLIRLLDRLPQFEGRSRFLTWATAIAIRVAMSELRRRRWKDVSLEQVTTAAAPAPRDVAAEPGPSAQWERRVILTKLHELIDHDLTDKQRAALVAELRGMPQDEIARHLGSNRNAVYKLTHDARKRLKRGLEAAGYSVDDIHSAFAG